MRFGTDTEILRNVTATVGAEVVFTRTPVGLRWAVEILPGEYQDTGVMASYPPPIDEMKKLVRAWGPVRERSKPMVPPKVIEHFDDQNDDALVRPGQSMSDSISDSIGYQGMYRPYMEAILNGLKAGKTGSAISRDCDGKVDSATVFNMKKRFVKAGLL